MQSRAADDTLLVTLCVFTFALAIGCLIGAVVLRASATWTEKLNIGFGAALWTVFVATVATLAVGIPLELTLSYLLTGAGLDPRREGKHILLGVRLVMCCLGLLIQSLVIAECHKLSFGRGVKLTLLSYLISMFLVAVIGAIVFAVLLGNGMLTLSW